MSTKAFLEISPLFEEHWTGLAVVTAAIAREALKDEQIRWVFFCESIEVSRQVIKEILHTHGTIDGRRILLADLWEKREVSYLEASGGRAVFTFLKPLHDTFGEEASIIYDLSPLIASQFHSVESTTYFADRFRKDVQTSQQFFCISAATGEDLANYFGVDRAKIAVIPMGAHLSAFDISIAQTIALSAHIEPYIVILGTLEPRKNGAIVMRLLSENPAFASRFRIVFAGRAGWLGERERLLEETRTIGIDEGRIMFTGFLTELEKVALLQNASFCVYPSYFEGYGLPVLEAAALRKIIVCSRNSSMPEVAPTMSLFFDPDNMSEFRLAIDRAESRSKQVRSASFLPDLADRVAAVDWNLCYRSIATWVSRP